MEGHEEIHVGSGSTTAAASSPKPITDKPSRLLTADEILTVDDIGSSIERVEVPEWGGHVFVKALTGLQRERYLDSMRTIIGTGQDATVQVILAHGSAKLAALSICDEKGSLMFERNEPTIAKLAQKSSKALDRVVDVASRLSGLDKKAADEAKNASAGLTDLN